MTKTSGSIRITTNLSELEAKVKKVVKLIFEEINNFKIIVKDKSK